MHSTAPPVLYSFRRCPYAIRARLAIRAAGVQVRLREVVLRDKPQALIAASPKATVPVLQLPGGEVLEESLQIMRWALAQHDPQGWQRAEEQAAVQAWTELNDGPFKQLLDRYKYASRHPDRTAQSYRDEAVELMLLPMEKCLARQRFLLRDTASLADIALTPFVRQFAACDQSWFDSCGLQHTQLWLQQQCSTALFESVMHKYKAWQPGDADRVF